MRYKAKPVLPDTDVLIYFLRGDEDAVTWIKSHSDAIILSSIVVAELYAGVRKGEETDKLDQFVSLFKVVEITADLAKAGGLYKRDYGNSHGVGLADGIIAATAESENADLKTFNIKHYPMLADASAPYSK